jgi:alpha-galactosidase
MSSRCRYVACVSAGLVMACVCCSDSNGADVVDASAGSGGAIGAGGETAIGSANKFDAGRGNGTGGTTAGPGGVGGAFMPGSGGMSAATGSGGRTGHGRTTGSGGSEPDAAAGPADAGASNAIVGATPPIGWNSWNTFGCNIDEDLIKGIADTFVSSGMQAAGYEYVNIDDCWMDGRDANGNLRWNASKFPSGIPALAEYVHAKGLKLGIYETPNTLTCVGLYGGISHSVAVGSLGHETADAQTFASWGVDYLKYDLCQGQRDGFAVMRDALRATGRDIFYSINPGNGQNDLCPPNTCSLDLPTIANMWRIGFDIGPNWGAVIRLIDENANLDSYAAPGHWNDPDMMEVGNGLNDTEGQAHFSLWAIMAAPLIAGNDIRSMNAATKTTLTNQEVIAVDQDAMGIQGRLVASPGTDLQVWSKALSGTNTRAAALFNRSSASASITVRWSDLGIPTSGATVRDVWSHADLGSFNESFTASSVPSHGVVMLKVTSTP